MLYIYIILSDNYINIKNMCDGKNNNNNNKKVLVGMVALMLCSI